LRADALLTREILDGGICHVDEKVHHVSKRKWDAGGGSECQLNG